MPVTDSNEAAAGRPGATAVTLVPGRDRDRADGIERFEPSTGVIGKKFN